MSEQTSTAYAEGVRLFAGGEFEAAERSLRQAVDEDPQNGAAFGALGVCQARRGDLPAAIESLEAATRLRPDEPAEHYNYALALFQAGRRSEARAEAVWARTLDPSHEGAQGLIAQIDSAPPAGEAPVSVAPTPASTWNGSSPEAPAASGSGSAGTAAPTGLRYTPQAAPEIATEPPSLGRRLLRGWLWGAVYGQWWTLWMVISLLLWNISSVTAGGVAFFAVVAGVIFAFFGSLAGVAIGLADADTGRGAVIGIITGLVLLAIQSIALEFHPINVIFYFFTGRYVGAGIAGRVQQPVRR